MLNRQLEHQEAPRRRSMVQLHGQCRVKERALLLLNTWLKKNGIAQEHRIDMVGLLVSVAPRVGLEEKHAASRRGDR